MLEENGYDFGKVSEEAEYALEQDERGSFDHNLLYVGRGKTTVKFLYNPASGLFKRQIVRHKIDKSQIACLKHWNDKALCPLCDVIDEIESTKEINLYSMKSRKRGLSYAQLVEANYAIQDIAPNEIILLMYPKTIYLDLSEIVKQAGNKLNTLIAENEGYVVDILRTNEDKYSAKINPYTQFKTINYHKDGAELDPDLVQKENQEFHKLLKGLPNLMEHFLPEEPTSEIKDQIKEAVHALRKNYLVDKSPNLDPNKDPISASDVPEFPVGEGIKNSKKEGESSLKVKDCYGKHGEVSKEECDACLLELQCEEES